jgi:hypothetical protein
VLYFNSNVLFNNHYYYFIFIYYIVIIPQEELVSRPSGNWLYNNPLISTDDEFRYDSHHLHNDYIFYGNQSIYPHYNHLNIIIYHNISMFTVYDCGYSIYGFESLFHCILFLISVSLYTVSNLCFTVYGF